MADKIAYYEIRYRIGQEPLEPGMRWFPEWYRSKRNRFVDRPDKEREVSACFETGRIVTLTGIGGTGKTRLAIACAARRANLYEDGVFFVSLATADLAENPASVSTRRSLAFVCQAISSALKRTGKEAQPEALFEWLKTKQILLLLDNYDSVRCEEVGHFLLKLVAETSGVSLLVIGRETLDAVNVEVLVDLNEGMTDAEARTLFLERARLKNRLRGDLSKEQERELRRILILTERIPLALELAAARIEDYSLQKIAQGLARTPLRKRGKAVGLRADDTIALRRHRSLERSLTWSYRLLDVTTQRLLTTASLFADTFDAATLQAVYGPKKVRKGLRALRTASLVRRQEDVDSTGAYRFRLHRATREFASQRLAELPNSHNIMRRFVSHYVTLVKENRDKLDDLSRLPLLDNEWRNTLAAADLAAEIQDHWSVILLSMIDRFLDLRGLWFEQVGVCLKALASARADDDRQNEGVALHHLGSAYRSQGRWAEAIEVYQQSLSIDREFKDRIGEGKTLCNLGLVYDSQGHWEEAIEVYQQSLSISREFKDRIGEGGILNNMGFVYRSQGRWEEALAVHQQSLNIYREFKYRVGEGHALCNMALVYKARGESTQALTLARQAVDVFEAIAAKNHLKRAQELLEEMESGS